MKDIHPRPSSFNPQDFLDRLQHYSDLQAEFDAILDIVENAQGQANKADQAEELLAQRLQLLGQQALQGWAFRKHRILQSEADSRSDLSRKQKKSSTGTPATAKSKSWNKPTDVVEVALNFVPFLSRLL